jgi:hypothetical protein
VNNIARILMLVFSAAAFTTSAQTPFLERTISISFADEPIERALRKLSDRGGFTFSYNPSILDQSKIVTVEFVNKTVRQILDQLFGRTLQYKQRGRYIILTRAEYSSNDESIYSGYIIDEATGERLRNVSVYDPVTLSSAVTDSYGYFEIKVDNPTPNLKLAVKKMNYTDTVVVASSKRLNNIPIKINTQKIGTFADSVGQKIKRFWKTKILAKEQLNMLNIRDTLYRDTQFSIAPFIGTNHALSGNVINKYSFNLLGGYSLGTQRAEVGGVFNIDRGDVSNWQVAGVFNLVGGDVRGVQVAGIFNANRGRVRGAQVAGIYNFNWGEVDKFSAAGILNFAPSGSKAVQVAGIGNMTVGEQSSPHFAGMFNITSRSARGQLAGIYNVAGKNVNGAQLAGIFNLAGKHVYGTQFAGIFNLAGKNVEGAQVAGILNFARKVKGVQFALLNVSDSVGGVPIGLMSVVLKGYHKIEIASDEIFYANVSFRSGIRQFYNIVTIGAKPSSFGRDETHWTFGYGLGTAPKLSQKVFLNLDLTCNQVVQGNSIDAMNLINKFYLGFDFQLMKKASLTIGATLNAQITDNAFDGYWNLFEDYKPKLIYDESHSNETTIRMWLGGKVGLRFL